MNKGGLIVVFLMVSLLGSWIFISFGNREVQINKVNYGYTYRIGYLDNIEESDKKIVLFDYDSFKKYFERNVDYKYDGYGNVISSSADYFLDKYDQYYFDDQSLAVLYIETNSGSIVVEYNGAFITDNRVFIDYEFDTPEVGTEDMSGYFIVVEVPKSVTSISN